MRQATLQLKTRINNNVNITNNNIEIRRIVLNVMLAVLATLALWYVLILCNMVFNIVERKSLEKESLTLSNEVGDLELSYLSVSNSIDATLSSSMGFKETKATFAIRKSLGSIKLASNEI
jgi:hypothetical protein